VILQTVWSSLLRSLRIQQSVPEGLRHYFTHLYLDVAWFGIVAGSSQAFLGIYVARLGASPFQMGLLNAGPALIGLLFTLPAGLWLRGQPVGRAAFWMAALSRIHFLWWVFLPWLFPPAGQVWGYLGLVLLMTIPGTVLAIAFNATYAAAVPVEYRGQVAGLRNAILSLVFVITSLLSGWTLDHLAQPLGYQLVFFAGFVGAMLSTYHIWHLRHVTAAPTTEPETIRTSIGDLARPGDVRMSGQTLRTNIGLRAFTRGANLLRVEVLRGSYGKVVAALFVFHFAQFLPIPVFPLFWVEKVHFSDGEIGMGTAAFHAAVLVGSLQFARISRRYNFRTLAAAGALLLGAYPLIVAFSYTLLPLIVASLIGGLAWSLMGGSLGNYLLEQAPEQERPAALAWYNLALNAAMLTGSLAGSLLAVQIGFVPVLLLAALLRSLSGVALWRWK
jgi:hypothetical protein